jgi:hypothetical protein
VFVKKWSGEYFVGILILQTIKIGLLGVVALGKVLNYFYKIQPNRPIIFLQTLRQKYYFVKNDGKDINPIENIKTYPYSC